MGTVLLERADGPSSRRPMDPLLSKTKRLLGRLNLDSSNTLFFALVLPLLRLPDASATSNSSWIDEIPVVRAWQTRDGLPQNTVYAITQTRDGYLWVGTGGGLARFDGVHFRNLGLHDGLRSVQISALLEDRQGVLWIGTRGGGLSRLENGRLTTLAAGEGVPEMIEALAADNSGGLWIGTTTGLLECRGGKFKLLGDTDGMPQKHVNALLYDSKGCLWVSVLAEGLYKSTNGSFIRVEKNPSTPGGVYCLSEDREGCIWAGSGTGQLWQLRGGIWKRYDHTNGLPVTNIESLAHGADGALWIGARNSGLYSRQTTGFQRLAGEAGLPSEVVRSLFVDREGTLWAGTGSSGLNRLSPRTLRTWSAAEGLKHTIVTSAAEDHSGRLWVATQSGGIYQFQEGRFTKLQDSNVSGNYPYTYTSLATADGSVWVAGESCLFRFREGQPTEAFHEPPIGGEAIRAMCEDTGSLWLGTYYSTLLKFERGEIRVVAPKGSFAGGITSLIRETTNSIWVGTTSGLYLWNSGSVRSWGVADGLLCATIQGLHRDSDGTLWIGTLGGGLARLKDGRILNITTREGLADDVVSEIIADDFGHLWLGCNRGIMRLERQDINRLAAGAMSFVHATLLDQNEGMLKEQCTGGHGPTALRTRAGQLLFPTMDGLVELDPSRMLNERTVMPQATIDEVKIDGEIHSFLSELVVPPVADRLEINYDAPTLSGGEHVHFRFKLEPLDRAWVDAGTRRTAFYPHIRPGRYAFRVTASNGHGYWNANAAALAIVVQPHFWQTLWFQVIVGLVAAGTVLGGYFRRVAGLERKRAAQEVFTHQLILSQENERKRVASDLHDGLGQDLLLLKNRLSLLAADSKEKPELSRKLTEISADASRAINEVREISQALRPTALEQVGFTRAVEWMVEQLGETSRSTKFSAELDDIDGRLPSDLEISLYRIIQEGLSNATRHARATRVIVEVRQQADRLWVSVFDDGQGFEPENSKTNGHIRPGLGLAGMRERAKVLGGRIDIQSESGKGTRLTLTAPLPKRHHE